MKISPESNSVIMCHEGIAASAMDMGAQAVNLKNANGVLFILSHATGDDVDLVLTVNEGATAAECNAATYPLTTGAEFKIWVTANCATTDVPARQADAVTYTVDAGVLTGTSLVQIYVPAAALTAGRTFVSVGSTGGGTGLVSLFAILDGVRYQQGTPLTAIA